MRSIQCLSVAILLSLGALPSVTAQTPPNSGNTGEIRGRVVDAASKAPVAAASIDVTSTATGAAAIHGVAGGDGAFRLQNLTPGRYRIRVHAIGYSALDLASVNLTSVALIANVGTVSLTAAPIELQSIQVKKQRADVQLTPDRNTYVVKDMPTTRGGTALDVLRNVPSVDVDIDNIVSLRGNSGVIIQINGRKSPMKAAQLGNYLAQLPADMVEKIEVIPNPSARDDPEGSAGIINIVLKKEADAGTSGGVTFGGGTTGHADAGANVGYQIGGITLYGSYGFLRDNRPRRDAIYRENRYLDTLSYLEEAGLRTQSPTSHTLTGSAGYELSKHDELSGDVVLSTRKEVENTTILYRNLNATKSLTSLSDRIAVGTDNQSTFEATLGYKHGFANKQHKLSSEIAIVREREGGPSSTASRALQLDGSLAGITGQETQTAWERPHENSFKVDYTRPLSGSSHLQAGYKGSLDSFHTTLNALLLDPVLSSYAPDTSRTSDFTYRQLVHAAYGMLDATRGKFLVQGGLRIEHATTQFHLITRNATYDNPYNSLFPSGLIAWNVDDARQIKLSYSTRIKRPDDPDVLDPAPHFTDPLNVSRGNPYLKPEYVRALELGLQNTTDAMTVQITPFFRHTINAVRGIRTIDSFGVATRTYANVATSDAYGADATVALNGGRLSGFAGASAFRQVSNAANVATGLSVRTFGWSARTNASYRASNTLSLQTLISYQAAMDVEQGHNGSRTQVSFAARKKFMEDRLSLTLRVIDPFSTARENSSTTDPRFYQVANRVRAIRGLQLNLTWLFGKPQDDEPVLTDTGGGSGPK